MRNHEQVIWDFVNEWLAKAEADLQAAAILLESTLHDYFTCAFHCQQAAEKFLKAFLVRHQIEFRKTHDLLQLLTLADSVDPKLTKELSACLWITPYGVEFRYPGEYPMVEKNTAQEAYAAAEKVKGSVMKRLQPYLSKGRSA